MSRLVPQAVSSLLLTLAATACAEPEEEVRHSVLLITLDTTRADALGAYGAPPTATPHLDRIAREGVVFESAFTVAPLTQPAHASMLTGREEEALRASRRALELEPEQALFAEYVEARE